MKGFLSLLGITLIVGAFGLILLSFSNTPLEELKKQERMHAYMETRQNHTDDHDHEQHLTAESSSGEHSTPFQLDFSFTSANSCENPVETHKKADSDR